MHLHAKLAIAVAFTLALGGCVTGYGAAGLTGGYKDQKVDDSHYLVKFDGNGNTSRDRVWYFWINRCAELTQQKGFEYFSIEPTRKAASLTPPRERSIFQPAVFRPGAARQGLPVDPAYYVTVTSWHASGVVSMYNAIPEKTLVYRAQSVLDQLAAYVKTDGSATPPPRERLLKAAGYFLGPDGTPLKAFPDVWTPPAAAPADDKASASGDAKPGSSPAAAPDARPAGDRS